MFCLKERNDERDSDGVLRSKFLSSSFSAEYENEKTDLMNMAVENSKWVFYSVLCGEEKNVNAKEEDGGTTLMFAALNGKKEVIEFLLKKGAVINAQNDVGKTALMIAAGNGMKDLVELLLKSGADTKATDY